MRCNLPEEDYFIGKELPEPFNKYEIDYLIGKGNNALVYKIVNKSINAELSCKFIPNSNILVKDSWKEEITKANQLKQGIAVRHHLADYYKNDGFEGVFIISDYVDGGNLDDYIKQNKEDIDIPFIIDFLKAMLTLLYEMDKVDIIHGDLHLRNILIQQEETITGDKSRQFKVIDFGVTKLVSSTTNMDDFEFCAKNLIELLKQVNYQEDLESKDRFCFKWLQGEFVKLLLDKDTTRNHTKRNPQELYNKLIYLDDKFKQAEQGRITLKLLTPFDFLSCEQMGESHSILNALYSDKFLALSDIESRNNLVLTGPRGCGKSTVFKCLSLKHRMLIEQGHPDNIDYIGVYYRCDDLWAHFQRYKLPARIDAYDIPLHFIISSLLCQLLEDIYNWSMKYFEKEISDKEVDVVATIVDVLGIKKVNDFSFSALINILRKERKRSAKDQRFHHIQKWNLKPYFNVTCIAETCKILCNKLSFLKSKPIYFFIDDYSEPKITHDLQGNLNRILMQRTADCFFKISTESPVSYASQDIDGKHFVEGREFKLLNLASVFLQSEQKQILSFIEDIFARRFSAVDNYPVLDLDSLLGNNKRSFDECAKDIRNKKIELWGKEVLGNLCSGDIFYIISLVEKMVSINGNSEALEKNKLIPKTTQQKVIKYEAGLFLRSLESLESGKILVKVVNAFGKVAHSYLKYRDSQNEDINTIYQASRIEPLESLSLSEDAAKIYKELLRYSLFFQDTRGKSQRGDVVPRLYLRRSLIPFFNLTFKKRDSIKMDNKLMNLFLTAPDEYQKKAIVKSSGKTTEAEKIDFIDMFDENNIEVEELKK